MPNVASGYETPISLRPSWRSEKPVMDAVQPEKPTLAQAPPPNDYGGYTGSAANHHHVYDNVLGVLLDGHDVATPVEEGLAVVAAIEAMHAKGRTQK